MVKLYYQLCILLLAAICGSSLHAKPNPDSAPCGSEFCVVQSDDAHRLNDAYFSDLTTDAERTKMHEIIVSHTNGAAIDWSSAAKDYFNWRATSLGYSEPSPGKRVSAEDLARQRASARDLQLAFKAAGEAAIRARLVDPDSAHFEWPYEFIDGWWKPFLAKRIYGHLTCGWVNARNRMGGYAGRSAFVVLLDDQRNVEIAQIGEGPNDYIEANCQKTSFPSAPEFDDSAPVANTGELSVADELGKLANLRDRGVLTQSEFEAEKAKLLGEHP